MGIVLRQVPLAKPIVEGQDQFHVVIGQSVHWELLPYPCNIRLRWRVPIVPLLQFQNVQHELTLHRLGLARRVEFHAQPPRNDRQAVVKVVIPQTLDKSANWGRSEGLTNVLLVFLLKRSSCMPCVDMSSRVVHQGHC